MRITFIATVLVLGFLNVKALAQSGDGSENRISSSSKITKQLDASFHFAEFDLGVLPSNEKVFVELKLENPTAEPFQIEKIVKSCNCMAINASSKVIPAGGEIAISAEMKTPEFASSEKQSGSINFRTAESLIVARLTYKLAGLLNIEPELLFFELASADKGGFVRVPFLVTAPISPERIKTEVSSGLKGLNFEISGQGSHLYAEAFVPPELLEEGTLTGELSLIDSESKRRDRIFLTVRQGAEYKISPRVLRFRKSHSANNDSSDFFEATAILRLPVPQETRKNDVSSLEENVARNPELEVAASMSGIVCNVEKTKISDRIYRLKLRLNSRAVGTEKENKIVRWEVKFDKRDLQSTDSSYVFLE